MPISREENLVCSPTWLAIHWSADWPARMSAPLVLRGWRPVRNAAWARAWSPGPSPLARALSSVRPVKTFKSPMKGFNGSRMYGNSVNAASDFGVQSFMWIPFGTYRNRSEEHTSELQSLRHLVCRLLLVPSPPTPALFPYTTLFRSGPGVVAGAVAIGAGLVERQTGEDVQVADEGLQRLENVR